MEAIYVNAGNDRSGNPRRGWVLVERGVHIGFVDEGYDGSAALRAVVSSTVADNAWGMPALLITPKQYRELRKYVKVLA